MSGRIYGLLPHSHRFIMTSRNTHLLSNIYYLIALKDWSKLEWSTTLTMSKSRLAKKTIISGLKHKIVSVIGTFYHHLSCHFSLWFHPCKNRKVVRERGRLCLFGRHCCRCKVGRRCRHAAPWFFLWVGFGQTYVSWNGQKDRQVPCKTTVRCNILTM